LTSRTHRPRWRLRLTEAGARITGDGLPIYLALWSLVLLSGQLSEIPVSGGRVVAVFVLFILTARCIGVAWRRGALKESIPPFGFLVLGAAGTLAAPATLTMPAAALWVIGIHGLVRSRDEHTPFPRSIVLIGTVGAILSQAPALWNAINELSRATTGLLFSWAGGGILGASASGLSLLVLVIPALLPVGRRFGRAALALGVAALLFVGHASVSSLAGLTPLPRLVGQLAFVACVLAVAAWAVSSGTRRHRAMARWPVSAWLGAVLALAWGLAALPSLPTGRSPVEPRTVLFVDQTLLGGWDTPADTPPATAFTGATFGQFVLSVEGQGHEVRRTDDVGGAVAEDVDLAVIINPGERFSDEDRDALVEFVKRGGGLLVMGDHTNMGGIMDSINGLTAPLGLSLAFDSADGIGIGWADALRFYPPLSNGFQEVEVPVSIGASVKAAVHPAVMPFLVGTRAYSDPGDEVNTERALLGNLAFDRGEPYGGIVLAAVRHVGQGKVALFGDTSVFQNSAMGRSHRYVDQLIRWLTEGSGSWRAYGATLAGLLLPLATALALRVSTVRLSGVVLLVLAAGFALGSVASGSRNSFPLTAAAAVIDAAHDNLIRAQALDSRGVEGLIINLSRAGFLPWVRYESLTTPAVPTDSVILSMAATSSWTPREEHGLLAWISQGGKLIVATGWPYSTSLQAFLGPLGLAVLPIPLGTVRPNVELLSVQPQLPSAWPLDVSSDWSVLGHVDIDETSFAVVAERALGRGSILVVGDGDVFLNGNLEGKDFAYVENLALLELLLDRPRGGEEGP